MKNLKFYLIIAGMAFGLTWVAVLYFQEKGKVKGYEKARAKQVRAIQTQAKEVSRKIDSAGIESVIFDVTKNVATQVQLDESAATNGIIDTTAMALDIQKKQLNEILVIKASLEAENVKLRRQLDASSRPYYTYSGKGLNLKFTPPYNELDTADQGTADFNANVSIKATQYWKRNWFLGAKKSILAVSSNSPFFKINGADFVEFEQRDPIFGLRIQAGANYNPQTGSIGFGPAARIDIGRLSLQGNYTWYPHSERWRPSINANYDIIRF